MADKAAFIKALSEILVGNKVMSRERAQDLQNVFGRSSIEEYEDFLMEEGLVNAEDMLEALSVYYKVPSFDVVDHFFETHLLREFPKDFLLRNAIIPLNVENHTILNVVAAIPGRSGLESDIRGFVSYDVVYLVGLRQDICDAVKEYYDRALTEDSMDMDRNLENIERKEVEAQLIGENEESE